MKAAGLYSVLGLLPSLIAVFTLPIYLRHLSVADYGALALLHLFGNFFGMIAALQLNAGASITYFDHAENKPSLDQFKSTIFTATLFISGFNFLVFLLFGPLFFDTFLSEAPVSFYKEGLIVMGNAVCNQLLAIYLMYQRNAYQLRTFMSYSVASLITTVCFQYFLIVEWQMGIQGSILGGLLAGSVLVALIMVTDFKLLNLRVDRAILKPTLKFAIPLIPLVFMEWFFTAGARLFVEQMMSLEAVGKVSLLVTFMLVTTKIFGSIWSGFSPELLGLFKKEIPDTERINQLIGTYIHLGLVVLSGTLMLGCNLSLLTDNPKFLEVVPLIPIASLVLLPKMLTSIPTLRLMFEKRSKTISLIMTLATAILIVGFITLAPAYGLKGILYAFLIANLINLLVRSWQCKAFCQQLLYTKARLGLISLVSAAMIGIYLISEIIQLHKGWYGLIQFILVLTLIGYISRKEIQVALINLKPVIQTFWISTFQKNPR